MKTNLDSNLQSGPLSSSSQGALSSDLTDGRVVSSLRVEVNSFLPNEMDTHITNGIDLPTFSYLDQFLTDHPQHRVHAQGIYVTTKGLRIPVLFTVPGQGLPGNLCSFVKGTLNCENGDYEIPFRPHKCENWTCPLDYKRVSRKRARAINEKLQKQKMDALRQGYNFGKRKHWAISPKTGTYNLADWVSDDDTKNWRSFRHKVEDILESIASPCSWDPESGFYGGILVIHMDRWKPVAVPNYKWDPDDPDSEDPFLLNGEYVKKVPVFSPHAHFIGYGFFDGSLLPENWIAKNIHYGRAQPEDGGDVDWVQTISYILTHQMIMMEVRDRALPPDDDDLPSDLPSDLPEYSTYSVGLSYAWVGELSTSQGGRVPGSKVATEQVATCPICKKGALYHVNEGICDSNPHMVKHVSYDYYWKPKGQGGRARTRMKSFEELKQESSLPPNPDDAFKAHYHQVLVKNKELYDKYQQLGRYQEGWVDPIPEEYLKEQGAGPPDS